MRLRQLVRTMQYAQAAILTAGRCLGGVIPRFGRNCRAGKLRSRLLYGIADVVGVRNCVSRSMVKKQERNEVLVPKKIVSPRDV